VIAEFPVNDVEDFDRDLRPAATLISAWISEVAGKQALKQPCLPPVQTSLIIYVAMVTPGCVPVGGPRSLVPTSMTYEKALRAFPSMEKAVYGLFGLPQWRTSSNNSILRPACDTI